MNRRKILVCSAIAAIAGLGLTPAPRAAPAGAKPVDPAAISYFGIQAQGVPACASCHGLQGQGERVQNGPRLAALNEDYLDAQLEAFAAGQRRSSVMEPIARRLTSDQRSALSAYFALLPPAREPGSVDSARIPRGADLALIGDWSRQVPPCASCHGPHGAGVGSLTPPLVGQSPDYLLRQLTAFREGDRQGPLGLMSGIAKRLSKDDLQAAAAYYAGLPLSQASPARPKAKP